MLSNDYVIGRKSLLAWLRSAPEWDSLSSDPIATDLNNYKKIVPGGHSSSASCFSFCFLILSSSSGSSFFSCFMLLASSSSTFPVLTFEFALDCSAELVERLTTQTILRCSLDHTLKRVKVSTPLKKQLEKKKHQFCFGSLIVLLVTSEYCSKTEA